VPGIPRYLNPNPIDCEFEHEDDIVNFEGMLCWGESNISFRDGAFRFDRLTGVYLDADLIKKYKIEVISNVHVKLMNKRGNNEKNK